MAVIRERAQFRPRLLTIWGIRPYALDYGAPDFPTSRRKAAPPDNIDLEPVGRIVALPLSPAPAAPSNYIALYAERKKN